MTNNIKIEKFLKNFFLFWNIEKSISRFETKNKNKADLSRVKIIKTKINDTIDNIINLLNKKTSIFLMPRNRSADIDDIDDFNLVKILIKNDKKLFK